MSDYRSFWFELAAKALPQAFFVAKGGCGGEAVVLAPNASAAREAAARIWAGSGGDYEDPKWFEVDRVPVVLCPQGSVAPWRGYSGAGFWDVTGDSDLFGDVTEIRRLIMTPRTEGGWKDEESEESAAPAAGFKFDPDLVADTIACRKAFESVAPGLGYSLDITDALQDPAFADFNIYKDPKTMDAWTGFRAAWRWVKVA